MENDEAVSNALSGAGSGSTIPLDELFDIPAIQSLMDDFYTLTGLPVGLLDLDSNVLVGTGWQDACTLFHRANPQSLAACIESDSAMSADVPAGEYRAYKCRNGMWDVVTPLVVDGVHVANIFVGQFFYDDETIHPDYFRGQAKRYGFDEESYIAAVESVPRFSHETIDRLMRFYAKLAGQLAELGQANYRLIEAAAARAEAEASDKRFRVLIEGAPLGVAIVREARFVYVNRAFATMFHVDDPAALTGAPITDLVAPQDLEEFRARARAREEGREAEADYEVTGLRADGSQFPLAVSALRLDLPDGPGVLGMFQDVSALKRTQAALRQSEAKFAAAFHTSPDAVTVNRLSDGLYVAVNEGFCNLLGYTSGDVMDKTSIDLGIWSKPADRDRLVAGLRADGRVDNLESVFRGKDGRLITALMSARIMDFDGERCILAVTRDITERKAAEDHIVALNQQLEMRVHERTDQLESANEELTALNEELTAVNEELTVSNEELAHANVQLDEATRAKNEFLASMSHELRTPLNSILGFSGTLLGGLTAPLDDEQRRQVAMINNSGRHLLELINGVLDLAKIEAGQSDMAVEELDPCVLAGEVADTVRPLATARGLTLELHCADALGIVRTDATRVRQILLNLLGNAIKFTTDGTVTLNVTADEGSVSFTVEDTGCGIAAQDARHVFDQFYQARPPDGGKTAGTGLGLSVSLSLAQMLGGDITMSSEPGVGSVFTLRLPRGTTASARRRQRPARYNRRVLGGDTVTGENS
ncbi:MAG: PocR ligand-binding domain-containing protein [Coriobacteriia bacterium]|nr:PocR ligand-binding domain-containing protein [Coriobacteriia bacterium]